MGARSVFISHSSIDHALAKSLADRLSARGHRTWMAPENIQPGASYGQAIIQAIAETDTFVVLISKSSMGSAQVLREVERAVALGKAIVPVRLDATPLTRDLEYFLSVNQWLDWTASEDVDRCAEAISEPAASVPPATTKSVRTATGRVLLLCIAAAFVAFAGYEVFRMMPRSSPPTASDRLAARDASIKACGERMQALFRKLQESMAKENFVEVAGERMSLKDRYPMTAPWEGDADLAGETCPTSGERYTYNTAWMILSASTMQDKPYRVLIYEGTAGSMRYDHDGLGVMLTADGVVHVIDRSQAGNYEWEEHKSSIGDIVTSNRRTCIANLMQISAAKMQLGLEKNYRSAYVPTWSQLVGPYIRNMPVCPEGGTYTIGMLSARPTCSMAKKYGHVLSE